MSLEPEPVRLAWGKLLFILSAALGVIHVFNELAQVAQNLRWLSSYERSQGVAAQEDPRKFTTPTQVIRYESPEPEEIVVHGGGRGVVYEKAFDHYGTESVMGILDQDYVIGYGGGSVVTLSARKQEHEE